MEQLLKQILTEIQGIKNELQDVKSDVKQLQAGQTRLESDIKQLQAGQTRLEIGQAQLEQKVDGIYQAVVRLEEGQPLDIYAILENIDRKLDTKDAEIAVLNKRVFKVETELESINRQ